MTKYLLATSTVILTGVAFAVSPLKAEGEASEVSLTRAHNLIEMKEKHPSELKGRVKAEKRISGGHVMSHRPEHLGKSDQALKIVKKHHPELHGHLMKHFEEMPVDEGFKLKHRPHFMRVVTELRTKGHAAAHNMLKNGLEGKATDEQMMHSEKALADAAETLETVVPTAIEETHENISKHGGTTMTHHKMHKKLKKHM